MNKLFLLMFLCSCAAGSEPEPMPEPIPSKTPAQQPAPPQEVDITPKSNCVINSYMVNNCEVTEVVCDGLLKDFEVKCGLGRKLFPWEYIPDPPYSRR